VSRDDLTARLASLSDVDVAGMLGRGLNEVGQRISFDDVRAAERRLEAWEEALGPDRIAVGTVVREVRGRRGYTVAAGAFARHQQWRRKAIDWLQFAIVRESRPDYDRWRWAAESYLWDIAVFARHQRRLLENAELTGHVKDAVRATPLKRHTVLLACAYERRKWVDVTSEPMPDAAGHNLSRTLELTDDAEQFAQAREVRLSEREEWKARAHEAYGGPIPAAWISRSRSIAQQIAVYQRVVADANRERQRAEVNSIAATLRSSLSVFAPAEKSDAEVAQLVRLAGSLGQRA
jgi:hypothetical protein